MKTRNYDSPSYVIFSVFHYFQFLKKFFFPPWRLYLSKVCVFQHILLFCTQRLVPEVWVFVVHFFIYTFAVFWNQLVGKWQRSECVQIDASVGNSIPHGFLHFSQCECMSSEYYSWLWCCLRCDSCDVPW
jgi:hypothetical protein